MSLPGYYGILAIIFFGIAVWLGRGDVPWVSLSKILCHRASPVVIIIDYELAIVRLMAFIVCVALAKYFISNSIGEMALLSLMIAAIGYTFVSLIVIISKPSRESDKITES